MKLEKSQKIELCASKDFTRKHLTAVHLDAEKQRLVATNGHSMAVVPVALDKGDTTGPIMPQALKEARKLASKDVPVSLKANGQIELSNGATQPRPDVGEFVPYEVVLETSRSENPFEVSFDAKLLWDLAQAIGAGGRDANASQVICTFHGDNDPIKVRLARDIGCSEDQPFGVLMPARVK